MRRLKKIDEITIKVGDFINEDRIIEISKDPFIKGQIDIYVNAYDDIGFGDRALRQYRIRKDEEEK